MAQLTKPVFLTLFILCCISCFKMQDLSGRQDIYPTAAYDRKVSEKYAAYSGIAFCPKTCIQAWTCGTTSKYPKLVNVSYVQNSVTKAAAYIGYDPSTQTLVTSWRGSNNIQNWIEDFNFETEPYLACKDCKIHTGFISDYRLNEKILLAHANAIIKYFKVSKIVCTGHSLGAALSLINGIQFSHKFPNIPIQVHNFGSPRIGNHKLALYATEKLHTIFRVVHNKDIVPHLPPEDLEGYHHPPYEIFFNEDLSSYKVCDSTGQDKSCSNQFAPRYDPNDHDHYFVYISQTKC